jgi:hypothetical protein
MSSRRLNAAEKQVIVDLYRQPGETAMTLADRFGVSNSTIGRILKSGMTTLEYDGLVQQKRGRGNNDVVLAIAPPVLPITPVIMPAIVSVITPVITPIEEIAVEANRELGREFVTLANGMIGKVTSGSSLSSVMAAGNNANAGVTPVGADRGKGGPIKKSLPAKRLPDVPVESFDGDDDDEEDFNGPVNVRGNLAVDLVVDLVVDGVAGVVDDQLLEVAAELGSVVVHLDDDELEDDLEEGLDEDFDDDFDDDGSGALPGLQIASRGQLTVRPLIEATLARICYLVVDRAAELIAPPLRDFGDLGMMSQDEAAIRTLPIFDNHRVAKRFANVRTQRVIKVPDSQIFYKVARHLQAKGINRLLVDGQVYSL